MRALLFFVPFLLTAVNHTQAQSPETDLATIPNYVQINDQLSTSGQIAYDQIAALKEAGFEVVINLAPARDAVNALEGFLVVQEGMSYVHIPVSWQEPSPRDLQLFFDVMAANRDRKVFVHCFANMRVSAFVYLYRTLQQNTPAATARADLEKVWNPNELDQWAAFLANAEAKYGR